MLVTILVPSYWAKLRINYQLEHPLKSRNLKLKQPLGRFQRQFPFLRRLGASVSSWQLSTLQNSKIYKENAWSISLIKTSSFLRMFLFYENQYGCQRVASKVKNLV